MFINETDLGQSIYDEVLQAVTRSDENFINSNIGRAIKEVDGYLNQKYDTAALWLQTGNDREATVKGLCVDVALYHIHKVLEVIPVKIREAYDYAKTDLTDIRKGNIMLTGIPLLYSAANEDNSDNEIIVGTNSKRF